MDTDYPQLVWNHPLTSGGDRGKVNFVPVDGGGGLGWAIRVSSPAPRSSPTAAQAMADRHAALRGVPGTPVEVPFWT